MMTHNPTKIHVHRLAMRNRVMRKTQRNARPKFLYNSFLITWKYRKKGFLSTSHELDNADQPSSSIVCF